jgi:Flp pilus assembly protein TadG
MKFARSRSTQNSRGQSLVETALMLPLLLLITLNVVNFGYFFLVIVNLTGAARSATLYAIQGDATPAAASIPSSGGSTPGTATGSVTYLIYQDLTGALASPTGVTVQVCSQANLDSAGAGTNTNTGGKLRTDCETCTSSGCSPADGSAASSSYSGSPVPNFDPEQPGFVLNRVDIEYTVRPLFPGTIFNIPLRASGMCNSGGSCNFFRHVEMRAMN